MGEIFTDIAISFLTFRTICHPSFRAPHKQGWMSTDDYVSSNAAFLWSQKGNDVIKCPVLQGGNAALFDYASAGPVFGAVGDLLHFAGMNE